MSKPPPSTDAMVNGAENQLLFPMSSMGGPAWAEKSVEEIREALAHKPKIHVSHKHTENVGAGKAGNNVHV